jgi:iduronate 2-sulfatase
MKSVLKIVQTLALLGGILAGANAQEVKSAAKANAGGYDIFLLIGQSNMDGRGLVKDVPPDLAKPSNDHIIFYHNGIATTPDWQPLRPGYSSRVKGRPLPGGQFGMEVSFAPALAKTMPGIKIALIKASIGNTGLGYHWNPGAQPNDDKEQKPGPCYRTALDAVNMAIAKLPPGKHRWRGILWHQGENDAKDKNYDKNLVRLVTRLRDDLKTPDLPFVFGGLRPGIGAGWNEVAPKAVDLAPNVAFVPSDGLEGDALHFNSAALLEFGERYALAMAPMLKKSSGVAIEGGIKRATLRETAASE